MKDLSVMDGVKNATFDPGGVLYTPSGSTPCGI